MKATETTVLKLLQGSKVFIVPEFQRRYSWRLAEWKMLWDDLIREFDRPHRAEASEIDGHFLGSIVLHPANGSASVLMRHLVIDGQQRLTTLLVLLAAIRDEFARTDPKRAREYDDKYLKNPYDDDFPDRMHPTILDRDAYTSTLNEGTPEGGIGLAYLYFQKRVGQFVKEYPEDLQKLGNTILLHLVLVEITTGPGDSVNTIFNTLNSKGLPLSPADLVRNELLLHVGHMRSPSAHTKFWLPMERAFVREKKNGDIDDREFVSFLWSREVVKQANVSRQELFAAFERSLREQLSSLGQEEGELHALRELEEVYEDHKVFKFIRNPLGYAEADLSPSDGLRTAVDDLRRWKSEPATPLVFWVAREALAYRTISDAEAVECLRILLGYLLGRALAGIPTNTLNRILSPIPKRLRQTGNDGVAKELGRLLSQPGFHWPGAKDIAEAAVSQPIYLSARGKIPLIIELAERGLESKERASTSGLTVEHIVPQSLSKVWHSELEEIGSSEAELSPIIHSLGNLTLTGYNSEMQNAPFSEKAEFYRRSPLELNRMLAKYSQFGPSEIRERSSRLVSLLLGYLPGPQERENNDPGDVAQSVSDRIEEVLQMLPDGSWTTLDDLVMFLGHERELVEGELVKLEPVLLNLVHGLKFKVGTSSNSTNLASPDEEYPEGRIDAKGLGDLQGSLDALLTNEDEE